MAWEDIGREYYLGLSGVRGVICLGGPSWLDMFFLIGRFLFVSAALF